MAKHKKDDMAAALDAMMGGDLEQDDQDLQDAATEAIDPANEPVPEDAQAVSPPSPARPPAPIPPTPQADARPPAPVAPATPRHQTRQTQPPRSAQPIRPDTPAAPTISRPATPADPIPRRTRPKAAPPQRQSLWMSLGFRQTLIPPLLTSGVLLLVFAALPYVMAADSAFAAIPQGVTILCAILGVVLLATAVLNMLLVSRQLNEAR